MAVDAFLDLPDGRRVPVRDGMTFGRVAACDVHLDDNKASRRHARLHVEGSVVEIEDLGSSNGTLLNGKPVQRRMLRDGDQVQIGATVIVFREGAPAAAPVTTAPPPPSPAVHGGGDEVDLFGADDADEAPALAARSGPPPPAPVPPPRTGPPPAPSPPRPAVVEFADEVVEVRAGAARPARAAAPPTGGSGAPAIQQQQRVLQFSKSAAPKGVLGDDVGQMSGAMRALVYALVLAGAALVTWLLITLMR